MWDAVEADFARDYGMDLMQQLETLSWRRFLVLLNNLSPYGAVATRIQANNAKGPEADETDNESDEAAANAFFRDLVSI